MPKLLSVIFPDIVRLYRAKENVHHVQFLWLLRKDSLESSMLAELM